MAFVKLDCGILDSTIWLESSDTCKVWITMLAMSNADGLCAATAPGIARRSNLPLDKVKAALEILEAQDPDSRTLTDEGRKIRRVNGGYFIINYTDYREKDHTAATRMRRYRKKKKNQTLPKMFAVTNVTQRNVTSPVTQAEAEAEAEAEAKTEEQSPDLGSNTRPEALPAFSPPGSHPKKRGCSPSPPRASAREQGVFIPPRGLDAKAWSAFDTYRQTHRKGGRKVPWTVEAMDAASAILCVHPAKDQRLMVKNSVQNNWTGVFESNGNGKTFKQRDREDVEAHNEEELARFLGKTKTIEGEVIRK